MAFSVAGGFGIVAPAIPLFAKEFGVTNFAAGAVISVFALVRFASAPVANRFSVGWAIFGVRSSLIPPFVVEGLRLSPSRTGAGLVLSAVVQGLVLIPAGRLVDTRGRRPFLRAGTAFALAAGVTMAPLS